MLILTETDLIRRFLWMAEPVIALETNEKSTVGESKEEVDLTTSSGNRQDVNPGSPDQSESSLRKFFSQI